VGSGIVLDIEKKEEGGLKIEMKKEKW